MGKTRVPRATVTRTRTRTQRSGTRARTRKEFVAKELGCGNTQNFNRLFE